MNYPNGIKKAFKSNISHGNRGMKLEDAINASNIYYMNINKAIIHKKPVPITISKVEYVNKPTIKEAYFNTPSTTDYNGIYKGNYIDFEAKETKEQYFPLNNIHAHQIAHLDKIDEHGGISFIIVAFTKVNQTFILKTKKLKEYLKTNKKSIPLEYFIQEGILIKEGFNPQLDYLSAVDFYFKEELK